MNQYAKADMIFSKFCKAYMELNSMLPISSSEMEVLSFVAKRKGQYISAVIANILDISKARVAKIISDLEEKEYVYKEYFKQDKRSFYVMPTEKGKMLVKEVDDMRETCLMEIERQMGKENFDLLIHFMEEAGTIARQYSRHK